MANDWKRLVSFFAAGKAQGSCSYDGGLEGCGSEAPELDARLSDCLQPKAPFLCEHNMQAYECVDCKGEADAGHHKDPAFCALPSTNSSPFGSPRGRPSPDSTATAPPCAFLEATNKTMRTDIGTWCPGEATDLPELDAIAPSSETTDSPLPALLPPPTTTAFNLFDSNASSARSSSSACGSHLHNLLQGGSRSSLLSTTTTSSSSGEAPCAYRTETQLLTRLLAESQQQLLQANKRAADLDAKNAFLCNENRRLRRELQQLQEHATELEDSVLAKGAKLARMEASSKRLVREVKELKNKLDKLKATASATPTTSPPTTSPPTLSLTLEELVLQVQGAIARETQRRACGHTGMTDIEELLKGVLTDPFNPNPKPNVALIQAKQFINPKDGKKITYPGSPSVWLWVDESKQQQQQQGASSSAAAPVRSKVYVVKVRPFHSFQRTQELLQGTFSPASTGSGIRSPYLVPWEKAATELITTTAMDRAARRRTRGAHGPFLAPLQHLVRPCSQVGGPLDVGYDMELVVLYEYCAGGNAEMVVRRAVEAVLRRGGSVKEAAAAGAEVAHKALADSLLLLQEVHDMGYILSDHKAENMVYHPDLGWMLIDSEGAVLCGPNGRVPGSGIYTPQCAAPEQKAPQDPWRGFESDMWATGALAEALLGAVEEACREAAEKEHGCDWQTHVRTDMGPARTTLLTLAGVCCIKAPSVRATLQDARDLMGV